MLLFLAVAVSAIAAVPEMNKLKTIYEQELKRLATESRGDRLRLPQDHIAALRELEMSYQQSGELKELLAVRQERERFVGNPSVNAISPVSFPDRLRLLQESYIERYRSVSSGLETRKSDLREKYLRALKNLQKDLTRQGKIESALAVMREIEKTDVGTAATPGTSSGVPSGGLSQPHGPRGVLDTEALADLLHGEVLRWNSYSGQITIKYDFKDKTQMEAWKGGTWDRHRQDLECSRTVAWARPQFKEILEIECDARVDGQELRAGIVIGNSLQAHIQGGGSMQAKLFQASEAHHLISFTEPSSPSQRAYHNKLVIQNNNVEWSVGRTRARRAMVQTPIRYPTYVGLGHMGSESGYDNVTITGILSDQYVEYLKRQ